MQQVNCPICGELMSKRGMIGHMAWKHGKKHNEPLFESKQKPYISVLEERVAYLEQQLGGAKANTNIRGENMDEVMTKKDYQIEKLEQELAKVRAGGVAVAESGDAPVTRKDLEIQGLRAELEKANSKTAELPSWAELYEHTKGCRSHAKEPSR